MTTLFRLDASARLEDSFSRMLADRVEDKWRHDHPNGIIIRRDLGVDHVPPLDQTAIAGFFSHPDLLSPAMKTATAPSDDLIGELQKADTLLFAVPLYNFGIPGTLKAWFDQVVRINKTFAFDGSSFSGLVRAKTAHVVCAYGASGYLNDGAFSEADFARPYMDFILKFMGIEEIHHYGVEGTTTDEVSARAQLAETDFREDCAA